LKETPLIAVGIDQYDDNSTNPVGFETSKKTSFRRNTQLHNQ